MLRRFPQHYALRHLQENPRAGMDPIRFIEPNLGPRLELRIGEISLARDWEAPNRMELDGVESFLTSLKKARKERFFEKCFGNKFEFELGASYGLELDFRVMIEYTLDEDDAGDVYKESVSNYYNAASKERDAILKREGNVDGPVTTFSDKNESIFTNNTITTTITHQTGIANILGATERDELIREEMNIDLAFTTDRRSPIQQRFIGGKIYYYINLGGKSTEETFDDAITIQMNRLWHERVVRLL